MPRQSFARNAQRGSVGERFALKYLSEIADVGLVLNPQHRADEHVEGGDVTARFLQLGDEIEGFLPDYVDDPDLANATAYEIIQHTAGALEVKTDWGLLFRTYDSENPTGTLPFALWANEKRSKPGWLLRILYPDQYLEEDQAINSVQPKALVFVLAAYQNVYACVSFSDIPALKERIETIAGQAGFCLATDVPCDENAENWIPQGIILNQSVWYIPLSQLEDIATVTMIGDMPRIRPDITAGEYRCSSAVQNQRYEYLQRLSGNRAHLPADEEFKDAFIPADNMKVFANIDYNLNFIKSIDPEKYPVLYFYSKQKVFRHLEGLMLNMLAHPYPIWPEKNPSFFAIGNNYLENWCKRQGIDGSSKSFQGSLVFLKICGLARSFRPNSAHQDSITLSMQKRISRGNAPRALTYRTVPLYTDQILMNAEKTAKRFYEKRISIAKMTKTDVINVLGQKAADKEYMSTVTVSQIEKTVDKAFFRVMKSEVRKNGYAFFPSVKQKALKIIRKECDFIYIDPISEHTVEERQEIDRQKKYHMAFIKFEERKSAKAAQIGLQYRQISNAERAEWNIPLSNRSWAFTKA